MGGSLVWSNSDGKAPYLIMTSLSHTHVHTHAHTHAHTHHSHTCTHTSLPHIHITPAHTYAHTHHSRTHMYTHMHTHTSLPHTHMHTHMHTHTCTHTHHSRTHMHTHITHAHTHITLHISQGVPVLAGESDDLCETTIDWPTAYACPLNTAGVREWKVQDPSSGHVFDLTNITSVLSANYTQSGTTYTYTIGLANHTILCPGTDVKNVGACQTSILTHKSYALGVVSDSLQYISEAVRTEYRGGTYCHLVKGPRKTVILFECDTRDDFLEVLPEQVCEYTFLVHTRLVCVQEQAIGVECEVPGFQGLPSLASLRIDPIPLKDRGTFFVSVCRPLSAYNQNSPLALLCPRGTAACSIDAL